MTLLILTGDSGVGKSTILEHLLKNKNVVSLKKDTTRPKRENEKFSFELNFISDTWFNNNIKEGRYEILYERRDFMYGFKKNVLNKTKTSNYNYVIIVRCIKSALRLKDKFNGKIVHVSIGNDFTRAIRLKEDNRSFETLEDEKLFLDNADYILINNKSKKKLKEKIDKMLKILS